MKSALHSITLVILTVLTLNASAQELQTPKSTNAPAAPRTTAPHSGKQADVASTTAKFGTVSTNSDLYKSALDAHALSDALKMVGKESAFKGRVTKVFEPRNLAILNFDENYHSALTAVVHGTDFSQFPALTNLVGKNVVVTGTFTNFQGRAEMVLTNSQQIKLVETEAK